jgi:hypothetical protein
MPRYASGKHALGISDRSGRAYRVRDLVKEWTGLLVGRDEFETKQPQLTPRRAVADPEALRNARPDRRRTCCRSTVRRTMLLNQDLPDQRLLQLQNQVIQEKLETLFDLEAVSNFDGFTSSAIEYSTGYSITKIAGSGGAQSDKLQL